MSQKPLEASASAQSPMSKILNPPKSKSKPGLSSNTGLCLHDRNDGDDDDDEEEDKDDDDDDDNDDREYCRFSL